VPYSVQCTLKFVAKALSAAQCILKFVAKALSTAQCAVYTEICCDGT
jgi:hypothetical protein